MSKKSQLLDTLVDHCISRDGAGLDIYTFDNDLVKQLSNPIGFRNHNDATHIDTKETRSQRMVEEGFSIVHLGAKYANGKRQVARHALIRSEKVFHEFEEIEKVERILYEPGPLDEINTSESNILSLTFNHGIINRLLYPNDLRALPSIYMSHRTRFNPKHRVGSIELDSGEIQAEVDMTVEHRGNVTVFEGKNWKKNRNNFAVYQLFMPYRYYMMKKQRGEIDIESINCCYVVRQKVTTKEEQGSNLDLYVYTFDDPEDMLSIRLLDSIRYELREA
jgi:hypothetical protein